MEDRVQNLVEVKLNDIPCFFHFQWTGDFVMEDYQAIRHDFSFLNPCWLFPATILSFMVWKVFIIINSTTFPRIKVKSEKPEALQILLLQAQNNT